MGIYIFGSLFPFHDRLVKPPNRNPQCLLHLIYTSGISICIVAIDWRSLRKQALIGLLCPVRGARRVADSVKEDGVHTPLHFRDCLFLEYDVGSESAVSCAPGCRWIGLTSRLRSCTEEVKWSDRVVFRFLTAPDCVADSSDSWNEGWKDCLGMDNIQ